MLKNAVATFQTEYHRFPVDVSESISDASLESNEFLMGILIASELESGKDLVNPREIIFYEPARPKNYFDMPGSGSREKSSPRALLDPWGHHYRVVMDTDGDGRVRAPSWFTEADYIPQPIIVWSPGPDGDDGTAEDNVSSW